MPWSEKPRLHTLLPTIMCCGICLPCHALSCLPLLPARMQYDQAVAFPVGFDNPRLVSAYNAALVALQESGEWVGGRWAGQPASQVSLGTGNDRWLSAAPLAFHCHAIELFPPAMPALLPAYCPRRRHGGTAEGILEPSRSHLQDPGRQRGKHENWLPGGERAPAPTLFLFGVSLLVMRSEP